MTKRTNKLRNESIIYHMLCWLCLFGPITWYFIQGAATASSKERLCFGITVIIAGILTAINVVLKSHLRSVLWVLVLGVFFMTDAYLSVVMVMAITTFIEELIFSPLYKRAKQKYIINKEIDLRDGRA